jgi:hypothetical protein
VLQLDSVVVEIRSDQTQAPCRQMGVGHCSIVPRPEQTPRQSWGSIVALSAP